jgi:hypothetical protein
MRPVHVVPQPSATFLPPPPGQGCVWPARFVADPAGRTLPPIAAPAGSEGWLPLRQHWDEGAAAMNPGWARLQTTKDHLVVETVFLGKRPRNRARRLNEVTHRLGDVAEIFLRADGANCYYELHVTPENQRLQLRWPLAEFAEPTRRGSDLARFIIDDPDWAESSTAVAEHGWCIRVMIPFRHLHTAKGAPTADREWLVAVCRYDWSLRDEPILSSTARLTQRHFHRWHEWHTLHCEAPPVRHDGVGRCCRGNVARQTDPLHTDATN